MPHYPFPRFIGQQAKLIKLAGEQFIQYTPVSKDQEAIAIAAGASQLMTDVLVPTDAPCFVPPVGPDNLEMYKIDSVLRIYYLREKIRRYENMPFPKSCHALVIDTNYPVSQYYADNMMAYCTGLIGPKAVPTWMMKFYEELRIGSEPTPYARHSCNMIIGERLHVASPWPTPGYMSNGQGCIINHLTRMKFNSIEQVGTEQLMIDYQWPARMSVALFFNKQFTEDHLLFGIIKKRAQVFASQYRNLREGDFHKILGMRWVDTRLAALWNEYDIEDEPVKTTLRKRYDNDMHQEYDGPFWNNDCVVKRYRPKKQKIEIEEIVGNTYEL